MAYRRERIEYESGPRAGSRAEFFNWMRIDLVSPVDPAEVTSRMYVEQVPEGPKYELNLKGLIAWLETKDPATWYNWNDAYSCLIGRFLTEVTGSLRSCPYEQACGGQANYHYIGANAEEGSHPGSWTFGQALARAKRVRDRGLPQDRSDMEYDYRRMMLADRVMMNRTQFFSEAMA